VMMFCLMFCNCTGCSVLTFWWNDVTESVWSRHNWKGKNDVEYIELGWSVCNWIVVKCEWDALPVLSWRERGMHGNESDWECG
jgi:hypothetical protein